MVISLTKTLPSSSLYVGSGATTVTLNGVLEIITNTKKSLVKVQKPKTKSRQLSSPSDTGDNMVIDLKRIEDTITLRGWLEDDTTETAWNKVWKLRAMCASGGQLTSFVLENITFPTVSPIVPHVFLESVTFTVKPDDTGAINTTVATTGKEDVARVEVSLSLYIGNER